MKILLINGSPHQDGCTNFALDELIKTLKKHNIKTKKIWIGTNSIGGCTGCNWCINTNKCIVNDLVNQILNEIAKYDGIVVGSPVHFAAPSSNLTSLLDRLFYGRKKIFQGKIYASIVCARRAGTTSAIDVLNKYALINNMYIIGSSYWNQIYGTNKEDIKKDLEGLQTIRHLGENMAFLLKCIKKGKKTINPPLYEKTLKSNFIK